MAKLEDLSKELQVVLKKSNLIPAWTTRVELCLAPDKERRIKKVRKDAQNWDKPNRYVLVVHFEEAAKEEPPKSAAMPVARPPRQVNHVSRIVQVLADMELRSGLQFIALKKFRDYHLPEATGWSAPDCDAALREAIQEGLVRTKKIPNPTSPYPTTAIESNRQHSAVQQIIGPQTRPRFQPVAIKGEPLSKTVLKDRR